MNNYVAFFSGLAVMAGVTYLVRMLPLVLVKKKIENKLDNVYNDYMNKCISVVIKSNPSCVVIVENNQKFLQKYYEFVIRMKVRCKMHGIEFKVLNTYA